MRANKTMRVVGAIGLMVYCALAAGATVASAEEEKLRVPQGASLLPDRYIVVLEDAAFSAGPISRSAVSQLAGEMARRHRGRVTHVYEHALRGFATVMSKAQARALALDPRVKYVEQDGVVSVEDTQFPAPWDLDRIDQRELPTDGRYTYARTGAGVNVYILDTGIRTTHVEFEGRAFHGYTAIDDDWGSDDCHGHGTHVAGTVGGATWGVAKEATLVAVRVADCYGGGFTSLAIAGVNWITGNFVAPAVANMSLRYLASSSLDDAVRNSMAAGVTYVVAAGNITPESPDPNACNYSPARVDEALTVGSSDTADGAYEKQGPCLDLFAPGVWITSAYHTSDTAIRIMTGTSMASPHVAGVAALYLERNPGASPSDVAGAIVGRATAGRLTGVSTGTPNLLLYSLPPRLSVVVSGAGSVISWPAGIDCGIGPILDKLPDDCEELYESATVVTLTATPALPGVSFAGWNGDSDCLDGQVTVAFVDKTCVATFQNPKGWPRTP